MGKNEDHSYQKKLQNAKKQPFIGENKYATNLLENTHDEVWFQ